MPPETAMNTQNHDPARDLEVALAALEPAYPPVPQHEGAVAAAFGSPDPEHRGALDEQTRATGERNAALADEADTAARAGAKIAELIATGGFSAGQLLSNPAVMTAVLGSVAQQKAAERAADHQDIATAFS